MESIFEDYQKQLKELKKTVDEMAFRADETAFRAEEKIKYYESLELQNRELYTQTLKVLCAALMRIW